MSSEEAQKYTRIRRGRRGSHAGPKKWLDPVDGQIELYRKGRGTDPPAELVAKWRAEEDANRASREALKRRRERKRRERQMTAT